MRSTGKGSQDEDDYEDDDFGSKKDAPSSNSSNPGGKDAKNNDKASAIRSKHSVTEQRRRSKINERFQILRDLIPHSEQKRDTASFLLEVIEYVQYLQERVNKHEGQGWSSEPTKLMPWRNSHWRVQSFVGNPQAIKNDPAVIAPFSGKFDEHISITPNILANSTQNPLESDPSRDAASKMMDQQPEIVVNKGLPAPIPLPENLLPPVRSDSMLAQPLHVPISDVQSTQGPTTSGAALSQQEELTIEGGTISISSVYSQGLLSSLSQALQSAGVDLSQATVSVQIDLGNRANRRLSTGTPASKDHENPHSSNQTMAHFRDAGSGDDSDHAHKRLKS